jgi:hypothetical protein
MIGLLKRVISPSQGLYLHRTTQLGKTSLERDSNPRFQQPTSQDPRLRPHGHCDRQYGELSYIGLNGKFLRFSNEKLVIFLNIFTIFNQLYNFYCLLLPSSVSQTFQFRPCKNSLVCLRHIFENAKTFRSTQ